MVFLKLRIGVAVRYRLPRPDWVLRLSIRFIRDLLLGGALPFGHCSILALAICPELFKWFLGTIIDACRAGGDLKSAGRLAQRSQRTGEAATRTLLVGRLQRAIDPPQPEDIVGHGRTAPRCFCFHGSEPEGNGYIASQHALR